MLMTAAAQSQVVIASFDYHSLSQPVADQLRAAAERIRHNVQRTLEQIVATGMDLRAVKASLEHGRFGVWLQAEFGWTVRTAQHFMAVAERFGPNSEMISHLAFQPTAAYLLAAPSVPDRARQLAIARAETGERITIAVAREILNQVRKKAVPRPKPQPAKFLARRLRNTLNWYKERWRPDELAELADELRRYAGALEQERRQEEGERINC